MTGLLIALYFALKKDIFQCHGSRKNEEDREHHGDCLTELELDDETERGKTEGRLESLDEFYSNVYDDLNSDDMIGKVGGECNSFEGGINGGNIELFAMSYPSQQRDLIIHDERNNEKDFSTEDLLSLPEAKVTTSAFLASKPKIYSPFSKVFKKINRSANSRRYASEKRPLCDVGDVGVSVSTFGSAIFCPADDTNTNTLPGRLQVSIKYDEEEMELEIGVRQGSALALEGDGKLFWQVCVAVLPHKKHRFKTKYKETSTPLFKERFIAKEIPIQIIEQLGVRFRIYGKLGRTGMRRFYGEFVVNLDCIEDLKEVFICWYDIKSRQKKSEFIFAA